MNRPYAGAGPEVTLLHFGCSQLAERVAGAGRDGIGVVKDAVTVNHVNGDLVSSFRLSSNRVGKPAGGSNGQLILARETLNVDLAQSARGRIDLKSDEGPWEFKRVGKLSIGRDGKVSEIRERRAALKSQRACGLVGAKNKNFVELPEKVKEAAIGCPRERLIGAIRVW